MGKNGIFFKSFFRHRLKIGEMKYLQIATKLHIKAAKEIVTITNVDKVEKIDDYIYFTALGNVQILFDCKHVYRYFNIDIISKRFTINHLKQFALHDILNNRFDVNKSKILKKYIDIMQKVLNIHISEEKIVIKQNKFHFAYSLKYKLNNRIKQVNVNQTLEEN